MVAAVAVGIGLLAGSTGDVQAACDPPVDDVCFHKLTDGGWTSVDGYAVMDIQFKGQSGKSTKSFGMALRGCTFEMGGVFAT